MTRLLLRALGALLLVAPSASAGNTVAIVSFACVDKANKTLPAARLAEAVLISVGYPPSLLDEMLVAVVSPATPLTRDDKMMLAVFGGEPAFNWTRDAKLSSAIRNELSRLRQDLGADSPVTPEESGMVLAPRPPRALDSKPEDRGEGWFYPNIRSITFTCVAAPERTKVADGGTPPPPGLLTRFGLGRTLDDVKSSGDERVAAKSAQLALVRSRSRDAAGGHSTDTKIAIDGTLGLRLSPASGPAPTYLYAGYTLDRTRQRPAPDDGVRQRDDDVEALELGIAVADLQLFTPHLALTGKLGYINDFVSDSERLRGAALVDIGFGGSDIGLCGLGRFQPQTVGGLRFRTRCRIAAAVELSEVLRVGTSQLGADGVFLQGGAVVGFDVVPPFGAKQGLVGEVRYRYLPTISGDAPNINRVDASLKYRWWFVADSAFDFGFAWKYGTELTSLQHENQLSLTFGILF